MCTFYSIGSIAIFIYYVGYAINRVVYGLSWACKINSDFGMPDPKPQLLQL